MAINSVGGPPPLPKAQTTAASTGPIKIGVDGKAKPEDIAKALIEKFHVDPKYGPSYAGQLGRVQSASVRTAILNKVEGKLNEYKASHPNATDAEIGAQASKMLASETFFAQFQDKMIMDMVQQTISKMGDTYSDE